MRQRTKQMIDKHLKNFSTTLTDWFKKHQRSLPWRETCDPYRIWISEVMLQQTTVAAVIPYYQRWLERFPTIDDVAKAPLQDVLKFWQGLGYYQRVRNLQKSAKIIAEEYKGVIPDDYEVLLGLPGFGPYTAGAVVSLAYLKPVPIIDANVRRVMMRILSITGPGGTKVDKEIFAILEKLLPKNNVNAFNQGLMELGATICRSKSPLCLMCPVKDKCQAYSQGIQEIIPEPKKKKIKDVYVAVGVIEADNQRIFVQQRPAKGLFAGLWEFPGGKLEDGETAEQALIRELQEELNVTVNHVDELCDVTHYYTQFRVFLKAFVCKISQSPQTELNHAWVTLNELAHLPLPSGSSKVYDALLKKFPRTLK